MNQSTTPRPVARAARSGSVDAYAVLEKAFRSACLDPENPFFSQASRYLSSARVDVLLRSILTEEVTRGAVSGAPSARELRRRLIATGLIVALPVQEALPAEHPHWLVLRGRSGREHHPFQVICALSEQAILSHTSALAYHELTLDRIDRHFITVPRTRRAAAAAAAPSEVAEHPPAGGTRSGPAIGKLLFRLDGNNFYRKQSFEDLIFGVSKVWLDECEQVQVFDRERSLLHTLTDPECNGGVRTVLEVWERSVELLRVPRMVEYLERLDIPVLWRRVGAVSQHLGLEDLTEAAARVVPGLPPVEEAAALIRGMEGGRLSERWGVVVPW